jgi:hypothetical protein
LFGDHDVSFKLVGVSDLQGDSPLLYFFTGIDVDLSDKTTEGSFYLRIESPGFSQSILSVNYSDFGVFYSLFGIMQVPFNLFNLRALFPCLTTSESIVVLVYGRRQFVSFVSFPLWSRFPLNTRC